MKIKFGEHKISLLTRIFGITPDTVRLYEKKGLLKPSKGENNYRIFSRNDFFDMAYILRLKEMGFSLQEIGEIAGEDDFGDIEGRIQRRIHEIEMAEKDLKRARGVAESFLKDIREIGEHGSGVELVHDVSILKIDIDGSVAEARQRLSALGIEEVPRITVIIPDILNTDLANPEIREETEIIYTLVGSFGDFQEMLKKTGLPSDIASHIEVLAQGDYLRAINFTKPGVDYSPKVPISEIFAARGLAPCGAAMSRELYSKLVGEDILDCYETWIPVRSV